MIYKPRGLWVSDDTCEQNWRSWCEGESFGLDRLTHVHDVTIAASANILRLCCAYDIDDFTRVYRDGGETHAGINWLKVAAKYDGIIITPYIWSRRLDGDAFWYYGWDCASGCIWNSSAVAAINLRQQMEVQ